MSKYELPRFYRLITKQCLIGLVLYSLVLSQTGCIFDRCSYWYIGFTPFCKSDSEVLDTEELAVSQAEPPRLPYTYLDGIAVGKQYAMNYGVTQGIRPNEPLPRQLAEAGLGEAFDAGCRDGINLYYRDQLASQQMQMANQPVTPPVAQNETQINPFANPSRENVIHPDTSLAVDPFAMMFVRKSDYQLVSTKMRNEKGLKKDLEANPLTDSRASIRFENISSDHVNVKDGTQIAPAADDLFTHSESLTKPAPRVESAPLQVGPRTSSRTKTLKNKTPKSPVIYSRSFDLPNMDVIPDRQDEQSEGKQTALPVPVVPSAEADLDELPLASPSTLVLRAEPVRPIAESPKLMDASKGSVTDNSTRSPGDVDPHRSEATPLEVDFTIETSEDINPELEETVASEKIIRLTARPDRQIIRQTSNKPEQPLETPASLDKTGVSSVLVETLDETITHHESNDVTATGPEAQKTKAPSLDAFPIHSVLVAELPEAEQNSPTMGATEPTTADGKTNPSMAAESASRKKDRPSSRIQVDAFLKPQPEKR